MFDTEEYILLTAAINYALTFGFSVPDAVIDKHKMWKQVWMARIAHVPLTSLQGEDGWSAEHDTEYVDLRNPSVSERELAFCKQAYDTLHQHWDSAHIPTSHIPWWDYFLRTK